VSILNALRAGVKTANKVTRNGKMQAVVMYSRETGQDAYGPTFAAAVPLHALVDFKAKQVRTASGELTATRAVLTLLDTAEIIAATGGNGIGNNDVFVLPDGDTGPTLDISGFVDAGTGHPVATEVMMG
jgi:hypothetical protein